MNNITNNFFDTVLQQCGIKSLTDNSSATVLALRSNEIQSANADLEEKIKEILQAYTEASCKSADSSSKIETAFKYFQFTRSSLEQFYEEMSKLCDHQNSIVDVIAKIETFHLKTHEIAAKTFDRCKNFVQILNNKLNEAQLNVIDMKNEKEKLNLKLNASNEMIEELKNSLESQRLEQEKNISKWQQKMSKIHLEKQELQNENENLLKKIHEFDQVNQDMLIELNSVKNNFGNIEKKCTTFESKIGDLNKTIDCIKNEKNEAMSENKKLHVSIQNFDKSIADIEEQLLQRTKSVRNLESQKNDLQKEVQILTNQLKSQMESRTTEKLNDNNKIKMMLINEQMLREENNSLRIKINSKKNPKSYMRNSSPEEQYSSPNEWDTSVSDVMPSQGLSNRKTVDVMLNSKKYCSMQRKRSAPLSCNLGASNPVKTQRREYSNSSGSLENKNENTASDEPVSSSSKEKFDSFLN